MDTPSAVILWLYQWQAIVGAVTAVLAAIIGAWIINRQIRQAGAHERERLARHADAARATLPLSLDALKTYAHKCISYLVALLKVTDDEQIVVPAAQLPSLPEVPHGISAELRETIAVSDQPLRLSIGAMLAGLQLQRSRLQSMHEELRAGEESDSIVLRVNIEQHIIEAAKLAAQSGSLFQYARRLTEVVPDQIGWDEIERELRLPLLDKTLASRIWTTIERRKQYEQEA